MKQKSRNQLRLERIKAAAERPGTIQYIQAHRQPKPRAWMLQLNPKAKELLLGLLSSGRKIRIK